MKHLLGAIVLVLCVVTALALAQTPNFGDPNTKPTPTPTPVIVLPPPSGPIGPARGPVLQTMMPASIPSFSRWTTYTSEAGGYSVKFPGKPVVTQRLANPAVPDFLRYIAYVNLGNDRRLEVDHFDFKGQLSGAAARQEATITGVATIYEGLGGKVTDRRSFSRGNCQMKEVTIVDPSGTNPEIPGLLKLRSFYSGDKLYAATVQVDNTPDQLVIADQFLDSFSVTGGCVDAIFKESAIKSNKTKVEGELDAATGWRRFETPHGISFLLPGEADLNTVVENTPVGTYDLYSYSNVVANRVFSVDITTTRIESLAKAARQAAVLDAVTLQLKMNLEKDGLKLGDCAPKTNGDLTGRECGLSRNSPEITGRVQIFATSKHAFILISSRLVETTDETAATRFFSSFTITEK